ncbi:hypothetical protein ACROYT_G032967 [Oculina patagonica]
MVYTVKSETLLSTLLIFQISPGFALAAIFQIERARPQGYSGWQNSIDYFGITSSPCQEISEYECIDYNALSVAQICNCSCPVEESTFTNFENLWSCIKNTEVRTSLQSIEYVSEPGEKGCQPDMGTLFVNEYLNSSLRVLNVGDEKAISLRNDWSSCELDRNYSWYFGCSASRLSSGRALDTMINLFSLIKGDQYYHLKVGSNVLNTHLLTGRIINLGIYCRGRNANASQTRRGCLLFKLAGSIKCSITKMGLPGPTLRKPDVFSKAKETASSTPTTSPPWNTKISVKPIQPKTSVTVDPSATFGSPTPIATVTQRNVLSHAPSSRPRTDDSERSTDDATPVSLWLVAAVTVSTLIIVLIIVVFVISRRSSQRKNVQAVMVTRSQERQGPSVLMNPQINSGFQSDEENGYFALNFREPAVYASMYQLPTVDRRTSFNEMSNPLGQDDAINEIPQGHSTFGVKKTSALPPVPKKMAQLPDNATRFQNYDTISIEQLVYNIVEEILSGGYERPVNVNNAPKETEPEYNVLEEPYRETSEEPHQHDLPADDLTPDGPEYNVLEEPYRETSEEPHQHDLPADDLTPDGPEYNVLEEPYRQTSEEPHQHDLPADDLTPDGPEYNVLEEPYRETSEEPHQHDLPAVDLTPDGPEYNVLEEPYRETSEKPDQHDDDPADDVTPDGPEYNVLEEPYRETSEEPHQYDDVPADDVTPDGPEYNVLEEPYRETSEEPHQYYDVPADDVTSDGPSYSTLEELLDSFISPIVKDFDG